MCRLEKGDGISSAEELQVLFEILAAGGVEEDLFVIVGFIDPGVVRIMTHLS